MLRWVVFCFALSFSSLSWAYKHGTQSCEDFEEIEQLYKRDPDGSDTRRHGYASCLVIKGKAINDESLVQEGLARLNHLVDHFNDVPSSYFLALYYQTDGTFAEESEKHIDKAIHYNLRTLELISLYPNYPWEPYYRVWEEMSQMELKSHYRLIRLYFDKFIVGATGTYHRVLIESPGYAGDKNLDTYPEHSPYTKDSLREAIEHAEVCLDLPLKNHFDPTLYKAYKDVCLSFKETALKLYPMEKERLHFLVQKNCKKNLESCGYETVEDQMVNILNAHYKYIGKIIDEVKGA